MVPKEGDLDLLRSISVLGEILAMQNEYDAADALLDDEIDMRKRQFGETHCDTLSPFPTRLPCTLTKVGRRWRSK